MRRAPRTRFLLAAAALTGLFWLAATPVCAGPATDRLREFFGTVNGVLVDPAIQSQPLEKVARIKRLVTDVADVRGAAAAVLDREWQARTPAEREEFTRLFAEFLERGMVARSEEHTSELQSRRDLVCRLLLEKKKKKLMGCWSWREQRDASVWRVA